jgi:hypothetical protein
MTDEPMPPMPAHRGGSVMTDWTHADAWGDLRLPARKRMARAFAILLRTGALNRSDIQRIGEVSVAQASTDLRLMQILTGALLYDKSAKCYRLKEFCRIIENKAKEPAP